MGIMPGPMPPAAPPPAAPPGAPAGGRPAAPRGADYLTWHKRIEQAREEQAPHARVWDKMLKAIRGRNFRQSNDKEKARGNPVNQANSFLRVVLPHLLPRDRNLEVRVNPKRPGPDYQRSADLMTDRLNALVSEIRLLDQVRRATRCSFYSVGVLKVGFEVRTGIVTSVPSSRQPGEEVTVDLDRERVEGSEYLDANLPFCCWVRPKRFLVDRGATHLDESRWVAHRMFRTVESFRADPDFAAVAERLVPTHGFIPRGPGNDQQDDRGERDPLYGYLGFYEIYDRDCRCIKYIGDKGCGVDAVLTEKEWPEGVEGFPFARISYDDDEEYFYPIASIGPPFDMYTTVDTVVRNIAEQSKRAKRLILYDRDFLKPDEVSALENARDNAVIGVRGLGSKIQVVDLGGVHADQWKSAQYLKGLSDEMSGVGEFLRASAAQSPSPSATEIQAMSQASGVHLDDMKGAIHEALAHVCGMLGALLIVHQDMLADVTLPLGDPKEQRFVDLGPGVVGEYLDYAYETVVSSTDRVDPAIKQKRTQDLINQSMDPNLTAKLQQEGLQFKTAPLLERQLRSLGETNLGEYLVEMPGGNQEAEQQRAQQEDQIMVQTGVVLPVGPNDDHQTHYQVHYADLQQTGGDPQSPIAQHLMMHEQYLMQMQQGQQQQGGNGQQPPASASSGQGSGPQAQQVGGQQRSAKAGAS